MFNLIKFGLIRYSELRFEFLGKHVINELPRPVFQVSVRNPLLNISSALELNFLNSLQVLKVKQEVNKREAMSQILEFLINLLIELLTLNGLLPFLELDLVEVVRVSSKEVLMSLDLIVCLSCELQLQQEGEQGADKVLGNCRLEDKFAVVLEVRRLEGSLQQLLGLLILLV